MYGFALGNDAPHPGNGPLEPCGHQSTFQVRAKYALSTRRLPRSRLDVEVLGKREPGDRPGRL